MIIYKQKHKLSNNFGKDVNKIFTFATNNTDYNMKFNFFQALIPKDKKFFPLFEKASANLVEISRILYEAIAKSGPEKRKELIKEIVP